MTIAKLLPAPFVKRGAVLLCLHDEANARRSQLDGGAAMSLSKSLCCSVLFWRFHVRHHRLVVVRILYILFRLAFREQNYVLRR